MFEGELKKEMQIEINHHVSFVDDKETNNTFNLKIISDTTRPSMHNMWSINLNREQLLKLSEKLQKYIEEKHL